MVQLGSQIQVIDNSGAQMGQCVQILCAKEAHVGDTIVVAVQTALPRYRVKRGGLHYALIMQTRSYARRPDGSKLKDTIPKVVLVNEKKIPLGSRVTSSFHYEIRKLSYRIWTLTSRSV